MWLATTVQTSGINWLSVLTVICSIVVAVGLILGFCFRQATKFVTLSITGAINQFHIAVVNVLDTRLTRVEDAVNDLKNTRGRDQSNDVLSNDV